MSSLPSNNSFAFSLFAGLAIADENVFMSPLSIMTALSLAEAGVTVGSPHEFAFAQALGRAAPTSAVLPPSAEGCTLLAANSIWTRDGVYAEYKARVEELFRAQAAEMPDSAAPINAWVAEHTSEMITELVSDDIVKDPLVMAILVNAVYFKGAWLYKFDRKDSSRGDFETPQGRVPCMMMHRKGNFPFAEHPLGAALAMPYSGGALRAIVVLPSAPGLDGLRTLTQAIAEAGGAVWEELRPSNRTLVQLAVPRFKLEYGVRDLKEELKSMGLDVVFDQDGGFLRMMSREDLRMSKILHKAVVDVTEEGTEAAAATAVVMKTRCRSPREIKFIVDRPFLFVIENAATGDIMFIGQVASPLFTS